MATLPINDSGDDGDYVDDIQRFNALNSGFKLFHKQQNCFDAKGENQFVFAYDITGKWSDKEKKYTTAKGYGFEKDLDRFIEKYNNFQYGDLKYFYEMLETNRPRNEQYDCDVKFIDGQIYATRDPARFLQYFEQLRERFIRNDPSMKEFYGNTKPNCF